MVVVIEPCVIVGLVAPGVRLRFNDGAGVEAEPAGMDQEAETATTATPMSRNLYRYAVIVPLNVPYDAFPVQSAELNAPDALCEDTFLPSTLIVQATVPPLLPTVAITL